MVAGGRRVGSAIATGARRSRLLALKPARFLGSSLPRALAERAMMKRLQQHRMYNSILGNRTLMHPKFASSMSSKYDTLRKKISKNRNYYERLQQRQQAFNRMLSAARR